MPNPTKPNGAPEKNHRQPPSMRDSAGEEESSPSSNNLWIGNLSNETTDADIMDLFGKYGVLGNVSNYAVRNYAFIHFKRLEDARSARNALQGTYLRGNSIRIEFARPAKPGKQLWVGGIGSSVTKEQLEDEFLKFGKIGDFKFLRDRNSALVDYCRLEDAAGALKSMNGKRLGGEQLRVDFLRSQPSRRENWSDFHDARDGHPNNRRSMGPPEPVWMPPDARSFPEASQFGHKRVPQSHPGDRKGQPSKVLFIGYPPEVHIDEQMLHNAMILFGEIDRIKSYPSRNYSFVEFRSVEEARRAKEGLQGRLFNDSRIRIMFSSSGLAPPKDSPGFYTGNKGPIPDMFFPEHPFGPGQMDFFGHNRPMAPNNFSGLPLAPNGMTGQPFAPNGIVGQPFAPNGMTGPTILMRPFGPQGGLNPLLPGPEMYNELSGFLQNFAEANGNNPMVQNWTRPSPPAPGNHPSPAQVIRPSNMPTPGKRDGYEAKPFLRDSKRFKIDAPPDDAPFPARMDTQGRGVDQPYGLQQYAGGASGRLGQGQRSHSPVGPRAASDGPLGQGFQDIDHCWRGTIAKGGTPVCLARCVPIGKGIDSQLPAIVNCSARTGLDVLAKHYADASDFDIVYFLPDSEDDFASYTEFLLYLGEKNRAGVAKFDDGTTLFLVPPSDFLTNVLKVPGPERLYGVVLKLPPQMSNAAVQPQIPPAVHVDRNQFTPSQTDYSLHHKKEHTPQTENNRLLHEDVMPHSSKPLLQPTDWSHTLSTVRRDYASNPSLTPQEGVSLPPELLANLAALLPASTLSQVSTNAQQQLMLSDQSVSYQGRRQDQSSLGRSQDHQTNITSTSHLSRDGHAANRSQQHGYQFKSQAPFFSESPAYMHAMNGPDNSAQAEFSSSQIQEQAQNLPQEDVAASRPSTNFAVPFQGRQFTVPQQANQNFQLDASLNSGNIYGERNATEGSRLFHSSTTQQPDIPVTQPTRVQGINPSQSQVNISTSVDDKMNLVFPHQVQQPQSVPLGSGQGAEEGEQDRNQRYQSTLQFAATLLLQIQQQQQQGNAPAAQGSNNH